MRLSGIMVLTGRYLGIANRFARSPGPPIFTKVSLVTSSGSSVNPVREWEL